MFCKNQCFVMFCKSVDCNPIENLWPELKKDMHMYKPKSNQEWNKILLQVSSTFLRCYRKRIIVGIFSRASIIITK